MMNEQIFWELIDQSKSEANGDPEVLRERLVSKLSKYSTEEILEFDRILDKYSAEAHTSELWAAAYIINGGCSDDGFDYFIGWLISQGREVYETALKNPESLADIISDEEAGEADFEDFLYIAYDAYTAHTGKEDFFDVVERADRPEVELTWNEDEEELEKMFPGLVEKFW